MTEYTLSLTILGKDKASGLFDRLDRSLKGMMNTAMGVTIARFFEDIGAAVGRMAIQAINAVSYVQNLEVVLGSLMARELYTAGGFENVGAAMDTADIAAQQLIHDLGRFAILSPYTMEATSNMFRLMMAFGSTAEQSTLLTRGLMTMGAGLGASNEQIQRMAYNLAQIQLEGKVTALDIRQLALAGLPLNDVLRYTGEQLGLNIENHKDFNEALESGKITWQQFTESFAKYADENFGGASERMARTLSGLKSTFSDVFTLTLPRILGPAVEEVTGVLSTLLDGFLAVYEDPRLDDIGTELGEKVNKWIAPVRNAVQKFSNTLLDGVDFVTAGKTLISDLTGIFKGMAASAAAGLALSLPAATQWATDFTVRILTGMATKLPKIGMFLTGVLEGVLTSLVTAAPGLLTAFAGIWLSFGQTLIDAAPVIISGAANVINQLAQGIINNLPQLAAVGTALIMTLVTSFGQNLPTLLSSVGGAIASILEIIISQAPELIAGGAALILALATGLGQQLSALIPIGWTAVTVLVTAIVNQLPSLLSAGVQLIGGLVNGIIAGLPTIMTAVGTLIPAIIIALLQALPSLVAVGLNLLMALAQGLVTGLSLLVGSADSIVTTLVDTIGTLLPMLLTTGVQLIVTLVQGILASLPTLVNSAVTLVLGLVNIILANLPLLMALGAQLIVALLTGILQALPGIISAASTLVAGLANTLIMLTPTILQAGIVLIMALIDGIVQNAPAIYSAAGQIIGALIDGIASLLGSMAAMGKQVVGAFWTGITTGDFGDMKSVISGWFDGSGAQLQGTGSQLAADFNAGWQNAVPAVEAGAAEVSAALAGGLANTSFGTMQPIGAQFAADLGAGWSTEFPTFGEMIGGDLGGLTSSLAPQTSNMESLGGDLALGLGTGWGSEFSGFETTVTGDLTGLASSVQTSTSDALAPVGETMAGDLGTGWMASWPPVKSTIETDVAAVPTAVGTNVKDTTIPIGTELSAGIGTGFNQDFPAVKTDLIAKSEDLVTAMEPGSTNYIGVGIVNGIRNGLESRFPGLLARARQMAQDIADAFARALVISSPSKVFARLGEQIPRGLAQGITRREQLPIEAAVRMAQLLSEDTRARGIANMQPSRVNNYNLTMPTSSNPNDIQTAFALMEAWNA